MLFKRLLFIVLLFFPLIALCAVNTPANQPIGVGGLADVMMEPVGLFSDFVQTACFVIGASFLFASVVKYIEHRRSPLLVPISTVIFLVILGVVLILIPLISFVYENGLTYSLFQ